MSEEYSEVEYIVDVSTSLAKVMTCDEWDGTTIFRVFFEDVMESEYVDIEADSNKPDEFMNVVREIQQKFRDDIPFVMNVQDISAYVLLDKMDGVNLMDVNEYVLYLKR